MKVGLISLGCSKNLVDSENILGWFKANQHQVVTKLSEAEWIVVNTCGFIEAAKQESIETLLDVSKYKSKNCQKLIAMGCLVQRYESELVEALPEVDAWVKIDDYDKMHQSLSKALELDFKVPYGNQQRLVSTARHTAYLKISEGCSNRCTFCAIPLIRHGLRSFPLDEVLQEAHELANQGVKELVIIAQDTTRYGEDRGENQLSELIQALNAIEGIIWIRLLYLYPNALTEAHLKTMSACEKVIPYFDLPLQHIDDAILKRMGRRTSQKEIEAILERIRFYFPQATLRTTFIVGFPGEDEKAFQKLLNFVQHQQFDRLGAFTYSHEESTAAAQFEDDIAQSIKEERLHQLMQVQVDISRQRLSRFINQELDVLIEQREPKRLLYRGRSIHSAPDDVDGEVIFEAQVSLKIGSLVRVRITSVEDYDMRGILIKKS